MYYRPVSLLPSSQTFRLEWLSIQGRRTTGQVSVPRVDVGTSVMRRVSSIVLPVHPRLSSDTGLVVRTVGRTLLCRVKIIRIKDDRLPRRLLNIYSTLHLERSRTLRSVHSLRPRGSGLRRTTLFETGLWLSFFYFYLPPGLGRYSSVEWCVVCRYGMEHVPTRHDM